MSDQDAEASLEEMLRFLDQGHTFKDIETVAAKRVIKQGRAEVVLEILDGMALQLDENYHGLFSAAVRKIVANGPELTARMRDLCLRLAQAIREEANG